MQIDKRHTRLDANNEMALPDHRTIAVLRANDIGPALAQFFGVCLNALPQLSKLLVRD
jgi:hypothetical protein